MKKLKLYVVEEVFKGFIPAFLALALIMSLGFCLQVLREGVDVVRLPGLLPAVFMYSVPVVLPSAFLTAVIMAFGRLSGDNEIAAIRVAGIHLSSIIIPVCVVALFLAMLAAYFQFEVVPKARRQMKVLQYRALKQILMDQVALSSRRQLSLGRWHMQYDDFRDGKMVDLTLLRSEAGAVQEVITAAEAVVSEAPDSTELVLFTLHDCVLTGLSAVGGLERRGATNIAAIELAVEVTKNLDELDVDERYLDAASLLGRVRLVRQRVREHPLLFRNPDKVSAQRLLRMREIELGMRGVEIKLRRCNEEVDKLANEERRKHQNLIEINTGTIDKLSEDLKVLEGQRADKMKELAELAEKGDKDSYDRMLAVQNTLQDLKGKIEGHRSSIGDLRTGIRQARARLEKNVVDVQELRERIGRLDKEGAQLRDQYREAARLRVIAEFQDELRSAMIRIHKRLALAASVFIFALVGIPLGVMSRRHSMTVALGTSFAIVLFVFYPLLIGGQILAQAGILPVAAAMWSGNALIFVIGSALMAGVIRQ